VKAKEITYRRTFHLGHMSCETIEIRIEVSDGETASEVYEMAKKFVMSKTEGPRDGSGHNSVAPPKIRKPLVSRIPSAPGLETEIGGD
jgi:hypothetical protein